MTQNILKAGPPSCAANVRPDDGKILDRCTALGLPLLKAVQIAAASDDKDPLSLLRLLNLDFLTFEPLHQPTKRWLEMAAQTSGVSYRGDFTGEMLEQALLSGEVPDAYRAHIGHFLDEAPLEYVVMAAEEAAHRNNLAMTQIWRNIAQLATTHSYNRRALWVAG